MVVVVVGLLGRCWVEGVGVGPGGKVGEVLGFGEECGSGGVGVGRLRLLVVWLVVWLVLLLVEWEIVVGVLLGYHLLLSLLLLVGCRD